MVPKFMLSGKSDRIVCFTSFNSAYLPRACILARTVRRAHPDWDIWALVVDPLPAVANLAKNLSEFDEVIAAEQMGIEKFQSWIFKHNVVEACTAVKGAMLAYLLACGYGKVIYLDPDIAVFHPMENIIQKLDRHSVVLTPHQVEPNTEKPTFEDNELTSLKYGIYNLGFLGVRNDETGVKFADWWRDLLYNACYEEVENGLYTDQKYCDLVPSLFPRVWIERDPGCNVASWNLSQRNIDIWPDGRILVNRSALKFYHFTKVGGAGDAMTARYAGTNFEALEIWNWYKRQIEEVRVAKSIWTYGIFRNGISIPYQARIQYRRTEELQRRFGDPFDVGHESYYAWLRKAHPDFFADEPMHELIAVPSLPRVSSAPIIDHYLTGHSKRVKSDIEVDEAWYLKTYPDVARAVQEGAFASAAEHYVRFGILERRLPKYIEVDELYYLAAYDDVRAAVGQSAKASAQAHFEAAGYREGRLPYPHFLCLT